MTVEIVSNKILGDPIPDGTYTLDKEGTNKQNALLHSLLQEWYVSGCHSYNVNSLGELKDNVKRDLGAGFDCYFWTDWDGCLKKTKDEPKLGLEDIYIHNGKLQIYGQLKSWSKYTKKERQQTIDMLIKTMIYSGVNSKKFDEILQELNYEK
ncbi:MAG: hypothetical protein Ta2B_09470 [Termitinemataceae bacterium]|nr:MAG: hypothetical protein Ta2B_09470 [Termitinemataceae bacterium]